MSGKVDTHSMISIIVPVYKSAAFLDKCVKSITGQTYRNLEILLIDDGSPDNSGLICDVLASEDDRIKVIHKENGGVSSARNEGLRAASGEYIMFVDSDDMIRHDMCAYLMGLIDEQTDLVVSGFYRSTVFSLRDSKAEKEYDIHCYDNLNSAFSEMFSKQILNCPYAKIFRRELIGDQLYDRAITLGEDLLFNLDYLKKIKGNVKISSYNGYMYYVANATSITNTFRENDFNNALFLNEKMRWFADFCNSGEEIKDGIDKILILDTMVYFQSLYFGNNKRSYKREKALFCLNNEEIIRCCEKNYVFNKHNSVLFHLIKKKRERCIHLFFKLKKLAKKL